jgi:ABC-type branched-subunit amino acid transport system ATPase component
VSGANLLEMRELDVAYGKARVVHDLSFTVPARS